MLVAVVEECKMSRKFIEFQPRLSSWFMPRYWFTNIEWLERRIIINIFNTRIKIRFTNMKHIKVTR